MKNRILSAALALCLCLGLAVPAWAAGPTFTDVPASHWAYDSIEDMSSRGVVAGFGNGRFGPGVNVTTAQFSVMLARLFYNDEMSEMPADEAWFRNAITLLAGKGVLDDPHPVKRTTKKYKDFTRHRKYAVLCNRRFG